jgi:hypothetical protein
MITFDPDARRARISRPGEAPIDGQLVCYYPCPRCSNPARALVYLGDAALAGEVVAKAGDAARNLGLLAVGAGLALNGGHGARLTGSQPVLQDRPPFTSAHLPASMVPVRSAKPSNPGPYARWASQSLRPAITAVGVGSTPFRRAR